MELEDIITSQRQTYIKQLQWFYENRHEGAKEILVAMNSESEELLFNLTRFDYLEQIEGEYIIEELSPDTYVNHQPIEFEIGKLKLELNPFFWHGCEFIINKEYDNIDWLKRWTSKWIDEDELMDSNENGLSGLFTM